MSRVGAIVQARMGSSRFPGKTLAGVGNTTLLETLLRRLSNAKSIDEVIVATTTNPRDDCIFQLCQATGVLCFRGSEKNVLLRYIESARKFDIDDIVRVTADNPLTDIELMDNLVDLHHKEKADYSYCERFPLGVATEVVRRNVLESFNQPYLNHKYQEHVTLFIADHVVSFKIARIINDQETSDHHNIRLTVDTIDDLKLIRCLADNFGDLSEVSTREVIRYLMAHPEVVRLNQNIMQKNPHGD